MKKILLILSFLLSNSLFAGHNHPPTPVRGSAPPPGLPVDQYLIALFIVAVLLMIIFKNKLSFQK